MKKLLRAGGFSLIELLVVIAIIMILAGMVFVVGPRMIERAKLASLQNDFNQIRTACVSYFTKKKETYPPAYGYKVFYAHERNENAPIYHLKPYVALIGYFQVTDMYDRFSTSYDTDRDGEISLLEFSPRGSKSGPDSYTFPDTIYDGTNLGNEVSQQLAESKRPIIYIPVNMKQAAVVAQYYYDLRQIDQDAADYATRWAALPNATAKNDVTRLKFPPSKYDDYVLISVGPANDTGGILTPPPSFMNDVAAIPNTDAVYNILALRAYYLATRDLNENRTFDFDYNARKGEDKVYLLPNGTRGFGPVIYHNTGA